jgi:regulatory protein
MQPSGLANFEKEKAIVRCTAFNYLSKRDYSQFSLHKKLTEKGFSTPIIAFVLQQLLGENLLNDERYCETLINRRMQQGYGPIKIRAELQQQGINKETIVNQLQHYETTWLENIKKIQQKKFASITNTKQKTAQQIRYLQRRGFSLSQIKQSIKFDEQ